MPKITRKITRKLKEIGKPTEEKTDRMTAAEHMERITTATDAFDSLTDDEKESYMLYEHLKYDERGPRQKGPKKEEKQEGAEDGELKGAEA